MEDYMRSTFNFLGDKSLYESVLTNELREAMLDAMDKFPIGAYMAYNGAVIIMFSDKDNMDMYGDDAADYLYGFTDKCTFLPTYWGDSSICDCISRSMIFDTNGWTI